MPHQYNNQCGCLNCKKIEEATKLFKEKGEKHWRNLTPRQQERVIKLQARYILTPSGWMEDLQSILQRIHKLDPYGLYSGMPWSKVKEEIQRLKGNPKNGSPEQPNLLSRNPRQ